MSKQNLAIIFLLGILVGSYVSIKYLSPRWVAALFQKNQIKQLNVLSGPTAENKTQTLLFYLGETETHTFGPAAQTIAAFILIIVVSRWLSSSWSLVFGLVIFIFLVLTKLEVLTFPPYGDAVGGPFAEAIWLANHGFNYVGLYHEQGYAVGGPKVYMFSIYPTLLAILLSLFKHPPVCLAVNHLIVFAVGAVMVTVLRSILQNVMDQTSASLGSLLLLFQPLFQAQIEAINMDIPCAVFILLSAYELIRHRIKAAVVMAVLAVAVKGIGITACAAIFIIGLVFLFCPSGWPHDRRVFWWGMGLMVFAAFHLSLKFFIKDQHAEAGMIQIFKGWPSISRMVMFYVFLVILIVMACAKKWRGIISSRFWSPVTVVMLLYGAMWFAMFVNFYAVSPRYRISLYPFFIFAALAVFSRLLVIPWFGRIALAMAVLVSAFSTYGAFYAPLMNNNHVLLERSLEYRTDLMMYQRIVNEVEEHFSTVLIGAPFITAQILGLPQLGYANKKLDVMIYGFRCTYGGIRTFNGLGELDLSRTVFIGMDPEEFHNHWKYPFDKDDKIIKEIEYGYHKAWLFMGGFAIERLRRVTALIQQQHMQGALKIP